MYSLGNTQGCTHGCSTVNYGMQKELSHCLSAEWPDFYTPGWLEMTEMLRKECENVFGKEVSIIFGQGLQREDRLAFSIRYFWRIIVVLQHVLCQTVTACLCVTGHTQHVVILATSGQDDYMFQERTGREDGAGCCNSKWISLR